MLGRSPPRSSAQAAGYGAADGTRSDFQVAQRDKTTEACGWVAVGCETERVARARANLDILADERNQLGADHARLPGCWIQNKRDAGQGFVSGIALSSPPHHHGF